MRVQKYSIFDAFREGYLSVEKIFVTEVFVDHFISFYMKENFFKRSYNWKSTEKHWKSTENCMDVALLNWMYLCINRHVKIIPRFCKFYMFQLIGVKMIKNKNIPLYARVCDHSSRKPDIFLVSSFFVFLSKKLGISMTLIRRPGSYENIWKKMLQSSLILKKMQTFSKSSTLTYEMI